MGKYSETFKEILIALTIDGEVSKARKYSERLEDPVEKSITISFIEATTYWFKGGRSPERQLKETWAIIKNADPIYQLFFSTLESFYYHGLNEPTLGDERVIKLENRINELIGKIDEGTWEYHYIHGYLNTFRASNQDIKTIEKAIEFQETAMYHANQIIDYQFDNNLGIYYLLAGRFKDAERQFIGHWNRVRTLFLEQRDIPFIGLPNLFNILFIQGKFEQLEYYIQDSIGVAEQSNNTDLLIRILFDRSNYLYESKGLYDLAEQDLLRVHKLAEDSDKFVDLYSHLIRFYEGQYNLTKDRKFLDKAMVWLNKFENHPNLINQRQWWKDRFHFNQAILLSHGNIRDKGKAMGLLEGLIEKRPSNFVILTNYLRLLFEELKLTEMEETNLQIKETIDKISQIPLQQDPRAIPQYSSQQRLLARYYFYIEGNVDKALNILTQLEEKLNEYGLVNMQAQIISDRKEYQDEVMRWQDANMSIRERIINSNIKNYIDMVQKLINK